MPAESIAERAIREMVYDGEEVPLLLRGRVLAGLAAGALAIIAAYVAAIELFGIPTSFDAEPFREWVDARGPAGPVVFILVLALSVLFAPIPNVPIFAAAGLAWGPVLGTAYSLAGMMLGSTMAFFTARALGRRHIHRFIGRKAAARIDHLVDSVGGQVVFWARMLPIVNFDWISFLAGVTKIRFVPFFGWSFLGMLVPTTVGVVAGDALGRDVRVTLAIGGAWVATIVASGGYLWWRRRASRPPRPAT